MSCFQGLELYIMFRFSGNSGPDLDLTGSDDEISTSRYETIAGSIGSIEEHSTTVLPCIPWEISRGIERPLPYRSVSSLSSSRSVTDMQSIDHSTYEG